MEIRSGVPLAPLTTLELGGTAEFLADVRTPAEVVEALWWARARQLPVTVLGGGSNVLVPDAGVAGLVLHIASRGRTVRPGADAVEVTVAAGEPWDEVVAWTVDAGWQGLECLSGIPGLTGATPVQNVGAYGQEVAQTITAVDVVDTTTLERVRLDAADCGFAYRDSRFKRAPGRHVVVEVTFRLRPGAPGAVRYAELERALAGRAPSLATVRATVLALRRSKSMVVEPTDVNRRSVGSFFTNPVVDVGVADEVERRALGRGAPVPPRWPQGDGRVKLAAGWLIEQAGLARGLRRGPVGISSAHALALVHHGGGTTGQLLELADEVAERVRVAWGVELEREPVLLGGETRAPGGLSGSR